MRTMTSTNNSAKAGDLVFSLQECINCPNHRQAKRTTADSIRVNSGIAIGPLFCFSCVKNASLPIRIDRPWRFFFYILLVRILHVEPAFVSHPREKFIAPKGSAGITGRPTATTLRYGDCSSSRCHRSNHRFVANRRGRRGLVRFYFGKGGRRSSTKRT